ncbi:matrixin family metalloprotease [Natronomonas marina]|jgi:hypothetical protein|uniref:matrixin family metalloprotease n=1 Tax=Natronomonas marina TaxID=2961939 RepID=UPI0020C98BE0|nr:matrixin family metalloprotease [Natronomonas marina]
MDARVAALGLALLVVLSGCTGLADTGLVGDEWEGDPDNHWRSEVLNVSYAGDDDRDYGPLVREALAYWTVNSEQYAGYDVAFRVADEEASADIHVRFVGDVGDCGPHADENTAGCAPVLTEHGQVDRPVGVEVRTGLSDESTVRVLEHELGHTLGLTHADEPGSVMRAESQLTTQPETNATERALPWRTERLAVYTDYGDVPPDERNATDRQVRAALGYFAEGADGTVPSGIRFYRVESADEADVVVEVTDESDCRGGTGSCGTLSGSDPDGDGALEQYTGLRIVVVDLDTPAVGWHVGRWLGAGFGHDAESDYPEPLRENASYEQRRSEWWQE